MNIFSFDNTFEGLLTMVFESYSRREFPDEILSGEGSQNQLFASNIEITTDKQKAERVWNGIVARSSEDNAHRIYRVFLSGLPDTPMLLVNFIRVIIDSTVNQEMNFSLSVVSRMEETSLVEDGDNSALSGAS